MNAVALTANDVGEFDYYFVFMYQFSNCTYKKKSHILKHLQVSARIMVARFLQWNDQWAHLAQYVVVLLLIIVMLRFGLTLIGYILVGMIAFSAGVIYSKTQPSTV